MPEMAASALLELSELEGEVMDDRVQLHFGVGYIEDGVGDGRSLGLDERRLF